MSGRKHSKKRDAILELIRSSKAHPPAKWVYEKLKPRFPGLSQGTVYRNINILLEEGELASAGVINGEERFDGEFRPHSHAICRRCGTIMDLPAKKVMEIFVNSPAIIPGFTIDIRNTVFYGLCTECTSDSENPTDVNPTDVNPTDVNPTDANPRCSKEITALGR